jgi:hypothetical protein
MGTSRSLSSRRTASGTLRPVRLGVIGLLMVVLAACGRGGGAGGGTDTGQQLQVMVINLSNAPVTVGSTSGGETKTVEKCDFDEVDFPLVDPFTLNVNDQPLIDSATLPGGLPGAGEKTVLAEVTIGKDGTPALSVKPYAGRPGGLDRPSGLFVQSSCTK